MKKLSIITINYNNLKGLKRTVESVVNQTWQEFEYIVIDGGSTDGSASYLENHSSNFDYWISDSDTGIYNAMNKGIQKAKGEYLLFLNSGDHLYGNEALQKTISEVCDYDLVYFDIQVIDQEKTSILENPSTFSFEYLHNNLPCHQSLFVKKSAFGVVGLYDEELIIVADWKWFIQAILKYNLSYKKRAGFFSVFYKDGISSIDVNTALIQKERTLVLEKDFPILMNDLKHQYYLERVIRNLRKSRKIKWLLKLGLLDKF
ncbi:glycosyltransferase family 2 protein [Flavobacterium faecale]|nr:glycosyltransferase family 2 protein [Flavobacterium faecale]